MSVIQTTKHPATGAEESFAKGIVKRVFIKRLNADGSPKVTSFVDKKTGQSKNINSTHRVSILLEVGEDSSFVDFGTVEIKNLQYENKFQIKEGDNYVDILPGMEISVYPVAVRQYMKKVKGPDGKPTGAEEPATSYEGKRGNITILDRTNAQAASQSSSAASGGAQGQGGASTKIYGEITDLVGSIAQVKALKGEGSWTVTLSDDQLSQVVSGGRLAGQLIVDGTISDFKAYGPVGDKPKGQTFRKDDVPIRIGNALTITAAMFPGNTVVDQAFVVGQVLAAMDSLRDKLRDEFKSMDDYSFGSRLGQCGILAAPHSTEGIEQFIANVESHFRFVCGFEVKVRENQKAQEPASQQQPGQLTNLNWWVVVTATSTRPSRTQDPSRSMLLDYSKMQLQHQQNLSKRKGTPKGPFFIIWRLVLHR